MLQGEADYKHGDSTGARVTRLLRLIGLSGDLVGLGPGLLDDRENLAIVARGRSPLVLADN
jgi:hypothetical protein